MTKIGAFLFLLIAATPATGQDLAAEDKQSQSAEKSNPAPQQEKSEKKGNDFDVGQLMQVVDKIFPAQPAPPAERLALARFTAAGVLPDGTYAAMFDDLMSGLVERILAIDTSDFGNKQPESDSTTSLREQLAKDDPHFDERMRIMRQVIGEELVKISAVIEPRLREGLALSIARRFDESQLRDVNAFLATESGRAFGRQAMRMWIDPDVMRSMAQALPDMILAMPAAMKRLEAATAHLPKPKPKPKPKESPEAGK